jgi:putative hydrolase of HD superfamily
MLQHVQGASPPGFDYAVNLGYGTRYTQSDPVLEVLRRPIDADT